MTSTASRPVGPAVPRDRLDALLARLRAPVDGASIAVFRIVFGLIAMWEVYRYFANDWIARYWIDPAFHFSYHGFGWVQPLPGTLMYLLWAGLGVAAAGITLGLYYRVSCALFALGFGYCFVLEAARYLNHFYLIALLAALLAIVPAHRTWSLAARRTPRLRSRVVPAWALWLLRFQIGVVYGGIAKIEPDWLRGEPMGSLAGGGRRTADRRRATGPAVGRAGGGLGRDAVRPADRLRRVVAPDPGPGAARRRRLQPGQQLSVLDRCLSLSGLRGAALHQGS